jgi:hypothetical protein
MLTIEYTDARDPPNDQLTDAPGDGGGQVTDLLAQGAAWLEGQRHQHLTRTVMYERGANSVELATTIGRTEFEQADEYGVVRRTESRDFLIRTADLIHRRRAGAAEIWRSHPRDRCAT